MDKSCTKTPKPCPCPNRTRRGCCEKQAVDEDQDAGLPNAHNTQEMLTCLVLLGMLRRHSATLPARKRCFTMFSCTSRSQERLKPLGTVQVARQLNLFVQDALHRCRLEDPEARRVGPRQRASEKNGANGAKRGECLAKNPTEATRMGMLAVRDVQFLEDGNIAGIAREAGTASTTDSWARTASSRIARRHGTHTGQMCHHTRKTRKRRR